MSGCSSFTLQMNNLSLYAGDRSHNIPHHTQCDRDCFSSCHNRDTLFVPCHVLHIPYLLAWLPIKTV